MIRGPVRQPADAAIGMMDGAYFTSRTEILDFFNNLLGMSLTKIEQTATGGVACQLMDYIFPGTVQMKRINWAARTDFQYVDNYKVLQNAFQKNSVQKPIDVDRLVRAKYQDNLEFCQWLKAFFDHCNPPQRDDYDPLARRALGKGGKSLEQHFRPGGGKAAGSSSRAAPPRRAVVPTTQPKTTRKSGTRTVRGPRGANEKTSTFSERLTVGSQKITSEKIVVDANLMKKNSELLDRVAELELTLTGIEKERDFYFEKLRGIEVMLQVHEEKGEQNKADELLKNVFKVLYATSEDNVVVTDDGEVLGGNHDVQELLENVTKEPIEKEDGQDFDKEMYDLLEE
mmetsp:Transcript_13542/g.13120  ORF Transcript_13542/g.13120 Transcript_13542/m.13120 type:complete len:342 (-) Transcript_13542:176-1201(-)|eukprot:CAMPEP_0197827014 /NCGR_PEP_ID=MMETSP1437-20131217/3897_1 /TAXON_ID=49252 ORGANISM="Eucampia antarctica, Strain CCMP1452" /NCGR_SAMPLE_ID=MMETSP1437 /ASSEMBLY_ACC=CAM_ASM_001096 /LENGTH=341 /DNA_ID=CAMNT_0043427713 /DNA_START=92 /DNA_END=1117 /DNA_ORIENTATION=+